MKAVDEDLSLILTQGDLWMLDSREGILKSISDEKVHSFDINGSDIYLLHDDQISFYNLDLRKIENEIEVNGELKLRFYDREPYTYLKADRHRIGLMSGSSLIFSNHGEINQTGKYEDFHE